MVSYERRLRSGRRSKIGTELCQEKIKKINYFAATASKLWVLLISNQPAKIAAADSNKQLTGSN